MGDGAGLLSLMFGGLLTPFHLARAWRDWMRRRPPDTQPLTKASHGAGILAFVLFVVVEFVGLRELGGYARALQAHPDDLTLLLPAVLLAVVAIWGVVWLVTGWRRAGRGDGWVAFVGVLSLAGGIAAFVYAHHLDPSALLTVPLELLAVCFIASGSVKILLMARGGGNARKPVQIEIDAKRNRWRSARR